MITLLLTNNIGASQFPAVQVSQIYMPENEKLAQLFSVQNIHEIKYPLLLEYVKKNPINIPLLRNPEYNGYKKLFEGDQAIIKNTQEEIFTPLFKWLDAAIIATKKEPTITKAPADKQKGLGTSMIISVALALLRNDMDTNQVIKEEQDKKDILQYEQQLVNAYVYNKWTEDWLASARAAMQWTRLSPLLEQATAQEVLLNNAPNKQWICNVRKAGEADIKVLQQSQNSDMKTYTIFDKSQKSTPLAYSDLQEKIIETIKKIDPNLHDINAVYALYNECTNDAGWFGPKYTKTWENLNLFLDTHKDGYQKKSDNTYTINPSWLKQAMNAAKKDRTKEKIDYGLASVEVRAKLYDLISNTINTIPDAEITDKEKALKQAKEPIDKAISSDLPMGIKEHFVG